MSFEQPWLLCFAISALLLVLGATSGLVNSRYWISEPLACLCFGVALGPLGLHRLTLDPLTDPHAAAVLREAARITLAIAVLAAGMRLPRGWMRHHWRGLAVALGPGMVLMWVAGAVVAAGSLGLPPLLAALVGAIISPTDPVLSAPVVGGELARRVVPDALRHAITAESAMNDGLAGPLVMLPLLLFQAAAPAGHGQVLWQWLVHAVLWQTGIAVVFGAFAGYAAGRLLNWARRQIGAERSSLLTIALALAGVTLGGLQAVGGNGVLGAFVAGATLNAVYDGDAQEHQEHFNEAVTRFFDLPIMVLLGAALPWGAWHALGWRAGVFGAGVLLLRRMPAWLLLRNGMPWARSLPENLFAGWFGPVGAAAVFYALEAGQATGLAALWPIVSLAAFVSVVAHGMTGTHFALLLGSRRSRPVS